MTDQAEAKTGETWQLGPQDEVGRWVFRLAPDDPNALHGVVGFHIGGVYGWQEEQERVLRILRADQQRAERYDEAKKELDRVSVLWNEVRMNKPKDVAGWRAIIAEKEKRYKALEDLGDRARALFDEIMLAHDDCECENDQDLWFAMQERFRSALVVLLAALKTEA